MIIKLHTEVTRNELREGGGGGELIVKSWGQVQDNLNK